jgi:membrane associated rhomboid family serine protease
MTAPGDGSAAAVEQQYCYQHPDVPTGVRCVRCDRPIGPECMTAGSVGFVCPECMSEGRKAVRQARTVYGGRVHPGAGASIVTRTLIGLNVVVFIVTTVTGVNFFSGSVGGSKLFIHLSLIPTAVAGGQWYRLITSTFLHFGIFHIAFNMYALYVVGPPLEAALGRLRFIGLYLLAGIAGGLFSVLIGPIDETAAGASGAIFGLFGAFYIVARHRRLATEGIAVTIVANLIFTFAFPNVDWRGHVGGLATGVAVAFVMSKAPPGPMRNRFQALGVGVICLVLAAVGAVAVHRVDNKCTALETVGARTNAAYYCQVYDPP